MNTITTRHINEAATTDELLDLMQDAAGQRGCELSDDSFLEQAIEFEQQAQHPQVEIDEAAAMEELAQLLRAAEERWQEIED
ncbi:MAG: hypothetical protein ACQEXC_14320 [Pseudomonadota bacterium]